MTSSNDPSTFPCSCSLANYVQDPETRALVKRVARRTLGRKYKELANDVEQEVYVKILSRPDLKAAISVTGILYKITRNESIDCIQQTRNMVQIPDERSDNGVHAENVLNDQDVRGALQALSERLAKISARLIPVLNLTFRGHTQKDIASIFNVSVALICADIAKIKEAARRMSYEFSESTLRMAILAISESDDEPPPRGGGSRRKKAGKRGAFVSSSKATAHTPIVTKSGITQLLLILDQMPAFSSSNQCEVAWRGTWIYADPGTIYSGLVKLVRALGAPSVAAQSRRTMLATGMSGDFMIVDTLLRDCWLTSGCTDGANPLGAQISACYRETAFR